MTNRAVEQEAREIVGFDLVPDERPSLKDVIARIAAVLQNAASVREQLRQEHTLRLRRDDELARVREELEDSNGAYRSVMKEACAGGITYDTDDRLHCTCVPHLREGIKALKAQHEAALKERDMFMDARERALTDLTLAQREIERLRADVSALRYREDGGVLDFARQCAHDLKRAEQAEARVRALREAFWAYWTVHHDCDDPGNDNCRCEKPSALATPPAPGGE